MKSEKKLEKDKKIVCDTCGGSGEIGFFQGESRFFITREECPQCCGIGYLLNDEQEEEQHEQK